jgi:hypothetical protein
MGVVHGEKRADDITPVPIQDQQEGADTGFEQAALCGR